MKKIFLISFQLLSILLLIFLAISTFMPIKTDPGFLFLNNFYESPINLILWLLLSLILVLAVLLKGIRSKKQKILHLALAMIIVLFVVDKTNNERFFITIHQGETVDLAEHIDQHGKTIRLDRFEIDLHDDEQTPRAYRSYLTLNDKEEKILEVNKPLALGSYRLYQSAFEKNYYFSLVVGNQNFELTFGDSVESLPGTIILADYNERIRHFKLLVNNNVRWLPLNADVETDGIHWSITPLEERYASVIEVVEVRGLVWLLLAGILYLLVMAIDFWKPRNTKEPQ